MSLISVLVNLAILNLVKLNSSTSAADADAVAANIDLSPYLLGGEAKVKRMTAPGIDSTDTQTATWAGQNYVNETAAGVEPVEENQNGFVRFLGSEAVLVFLQQSGDSELHLYAQ